MKSTHLSMLAASAFLISVFSCTQPVVHNTLSEAEIKDHWELLFDGKTLNGWHLFNGGAVASAWSVDSGRLVCNPHAKNVKHGDLVTDKTYENFDLVFEWKISKAGNSGMFVDVQERPDLATTFSTGPEYQLLDDNNVPPDYLDHGLHKAASIFGVIPNNSNSSPKSGEWNQSRIQQQNGKLTFWLNGEQTIDIDLKSDEWKNLVAASPLGHYAEFGKATQGHLAVQDWTNGVSFRDMKIRNLGGTEEHHMMDTVPSVSHTENKDGTVAGVDTLKFSDTIQLRAGENMRFDKELFKVKAGKKLRLILTNTSKVSSATMQHNAVVLTEKTDIADFADAVHNAKDEQYVPSSVASLVVAHTRLVAAGETDNVELILPHPGVYHFICSYPGHWGTMQGIIVAE